MKPEKPQFDFVHLQVVGICTMESDSPGEDIAPTQFSMKVYDVEKWFNHFVPPHAIEAITETPGDDPRTVVQIYGRNFEVLETKENIFEQVRKIIARRTSDPMTTAAQSLFPLLQKKLLEEMGGAAPGSEFPDPDRDPRVRVDPGSAHSPAKVKRRESLDKEWDELTENGGDPMDQAAEEAANRIPEHLKPESTPQNDGKEG